jgi:hypothetical protein
MLQTDESWECFSALSAIFNQPGLRSYRFVEVAINIPLFHLDLVLLGDEETGHAWSRFICYQLADVLSVIGRCDVANARISIQTPRKGDGYTFFSISQVIEGRNQAGDILHLFIGSNGEEYIHALRGEGDADMLDRRILWSRRAED